MDQEMLEFISQLISPEGVSDLFVTAGKPPSVRRNGLLEVQTEWENVDAAVIDTFRASVLSAEEEECYRRNGSVDGSFELAEGGRCRVNFFLSLGGPAFVARPIRSGDDIDFVRLRLPEQLLAPLAGLTHGLVIVSVATGSGKSTTMNAVINAINASRRVHIITIEDPIEYMHRDKLALVTQREVGPREGGFSAALRSALRENPDVIVIGEMRDLETMQTALRAALTGHLVITTLHAADSVQSLERIIGMFPEGARDRVAEELSSALEAVICQRLLSAADGSGLIPALEVMRATEFIRRQIVLRDSASLETAVASGMEEGMTNFLRSIYELYRSGEVTEEEALRACGNPDEFRLMLKGMTTGSGSRYAAEGGADNRNLVDMRTLFRSAVRAGASDLLLSVTMPPMLRISGECRALDLPPLSATDAHRLLYSILNRRQRAVFEEKRELDFAIAVDLPGKEGGTTIHARFRINVFFQRGTPAMVARVVNDTIPAPEALNLPPIMLELSEKKQGLILVTGPTGSGKSTTLASLLDRVNHRRACHIVTVEDPIEYIYRNDLAVFEQRELNADTYSFSDALRSALRQAPDIILVGEMRDTATIAAALTAAETGHLVFGTLHTNSAPQTVDRIIDSFPAAQQNQIRQQFAACLLAVVSQRLLPRADRPGRIAAFEVMVATPAVQALIRENKTYQLPSMLETGAKDGMITLDRCLEKLCAAGIISPESRASFMLTHTAG